MKYHAVNDRLGLFFKVELPLPSLTHHHGKSRMITIMKICRVADTYREKKQQIYIVYNTGERNIDQGTGGPKKYIYISTVLRRFICKKIFTKRKNTKKWTRVHVIQGRSANTFLERSAERERPAETVCLLASFLSHARVANPLVRYGNWLRSSCCLLNDKGTWKH